MPINYKFRGGKIPFLQCGCGSISCDVSQTIPSMKTCRKCGVKYVGLQCEDCGGHRENSFPAPPKICLVHGCERDTAVNRIVIRGPHGSPFAPVIAAKYLHERGGRSYMAAGYELVQHVTRCAECFHREAGAEWRDQMIGCEIKKHPEIGKANYSDPVDRKDIFAIASMLAMRQKVRAPAPEDRNSEAVLTGQVITPERIALADTSVFERRT